MVEAFPYWHVLFQETMFLNDMDVKIKATHSKHAVCSMLYNVTACILTVSFFVKRLTVPYGWWEVSVSQDEATSGIRKY